MNTNSSSFRRKKRPEEQSSGQLFLTELSRKEADVISFTIEGKSLLLPAIRWERIEQGWENPTPFTAHWQAEAVARTLALRSNGERAYRVVNPGGKVLQVFWVKKILIVTQERRSVTELEDIPADFDVPLISQVLQERRQRKRVFFSSLDLNGLFAR